MKLLIAFALLGVALAKCPNACSGHGDCGANDACTCYSGFQGGDCSERVCMYNWAWVTTANGDLNFDGDVFDGTVYTPSSRINLANIVPSDGVGGATLLTQAAPGGTWESWPYYGVAEEGHFYMECSNRGLCDRQKGDCQCFEGYEGTSCNRMVCPEDCNGHGTCVTVGYYDSSYALWDKEMARSCKCDPGYTGPACQTRECPYGNDVLTKDNELAEVQYVDIYSVCYGAGDSDCPTESATSILGGTARLSLTDHFGESYTTDPFAVCAMGATGCNGVTIAAGAQTALRALPNNVTSSTLSVSAEYCEQANDAGVDFDATTGPSDDTIKGYRVPGGTESAGIYAYSGGAMMKRIPYATGITIGDIFNGADDDDQQIAILANPHCIRLKITFTGMPGDIADLVVDDSDVTFGGLTDAQREAALVSSAVTSDLQLTTGDTLTGLYRAPATNQMAMAKADVVRGTPSSLDFDPDDGDAGPYFHATNGDIFYPGQKVKIECLEGSTNRNLGFYTVSDPSTFGTQEAMSNEVLKVDEYILPCTATDSKYQVTSVQNVVQLSGVKSSALHPFNPTQIQSITGSRVKFAVASEGTYTFGATVTAAKFLAATDGTNPLVLASSAFATNTGYLIIGDEDPTGALVQGVTAAVLETKLAGAVDGSQVVTLSTDMDGTMENSPCGDRGMCQDDGTCKCFAGYTGDSCSIQKSISM